MDYSKLGLKVGLEIHQQLSSGTKLFCRCPIMRSENFPIEVRRKLRAVPGELGDVDPAALQEYLKNKTFVYRANGESACLVETDEDPPRPMNELALKTCIQICKLLNCSVFSELHAMRKTVVDGSAVSGFQRTTLVGADGYVEGDFGRISVKTTMLEEDASTPVAKNEGIVEYRLDRLGIPLVEIATGSEISSPGMAMRVAEKIGLLLRSVDVVRGIGSIRQDINVSIAGGARIEIKGFQELEKIPAVIENEINRQVALLEIKDELKKRGFKGIVNKAQTGAAKQHQPFGKDVTDIFRNTKFNSIRRIVDGKGFVYAMLLPKFAGFLKKQCGDRTFGKELSAYAESYGLGIIHSDEDISKYSLAMEFQKLRQELKADPEDLILVTAGAGKARIENALVLLANRANYCAVGVPEETRAADGAGSKYARPLPGAGRLYPESDIPPVRLPKEFLDSVKTPKTVFERQEEVVRQLVKEYKMNEAAARSVASMKNVISGGEISRLIRLSKQFRNVEAATIAKILFEMPKEIRARFSMDAGRIDDDARLKVLTALNDKKIPESAILFIFVDYLSGTPLDGAIGKYSVLSDRELRKIVKDTLAEHKGKKESVLMGIIMQKVRGKADGAKVSKLLKEMT